MEARVIVGQAYDPSYGLSSTPKTYYVIDTGTIPAREDGKWFTEAGEETQFSPIDAYVCIGATGSIGNWTGVTGSSVYRVPLFAVQEVYNTTSCCGTGPSNIEPRVIIGQSYDPSFGLSTNSELFYIIDSGSIPTRKDGKWFNQASENTQFIAIDTYLCVGATGLTGNWSPVANSQVKNVPLFATTSILHWDSCCGGDTGTSGTGPQGPTGPTGNTGAQGPQGFTGTQGVQGNQGFDGTQGTQGTQGLTGPQGAQGFQGDIGNQGFDGVQGPQGFAGTQGVQGSSGSSGPQGFTGTQGPQGFTGAQGPQGFTGVQGVRGFQGAQGVRGFQGFQGSIGAQGFQGNIGAQGFQGDIGNQGFDGPQGFQGFTGPAASAMLPIPSVKLGLSQAIPSVDMPNNSSGLDLIFISAPYITTTDISQATFNAFTKIYVEMVLYRRGKRNTSFEAKSKGAGYIVPTPHYPNGSYGYPAWGTSFWTRSGAPWNTLTNSTLGVDRPNHFPVTSTNQNINVAPMLSHRWGLNDVYYRDITGNLASYNTYVPVSNKNNGGSNKPTRRYSYAPIYVPMYIAFRYVAYRKPTADVPRGEIVSGPLSRVVKIMHQNVPFLLDYNASSSVGRPCASINLLHDPRTLKCMFETHLP